MAGRQPHLLPACFGKRVVQSAAQDFTTFRLAVAENVYDDSDSAALLSWNLINFNLWSHFSRCPSLSTFTAR